MSKVEQEIPLSSGGSDTGANAQQEPLLCKYSVYLLSFTLNSASSNLASSSRMPL